MTSPDLIDIDHLLSDEEKQIARFGAQCSRLALAFEDDAPTSVDRRVIAASPHMVSGGDPASVGKATCWRTKCRNVAISTHTKASGGPESCRL
jgi:hypothetical protein